MERHNLKALYCVFFALIAGTKVDGARTKREDIDEGAKATKNSKINNKEKCSKSVELNQSELIQQTQKQLNVLEKKLLEIKKIHEMSQNEDKEVEENDVMQIQDQGNMGTKIRIFWPKNELPKIIAPKIVEHDVVENNAQHLDSTQKISLPKKFAENNESSDIIQNFPFSQQETLSTQQEKNNVYKSNACLKKSFENPRIVSDESSESSESIQRNQWFCSEESRDSNSSKPKRLFKKQIMEADKRLEKERRKQEKKDLKRKEKEERERQIKKQERREKMRLKKLKNANIF